MWRMNKVPTISSACAVNVGGAPSPSKLTQDIQCSHGQPSGELLSSRSVPCRSGSRKTSEISGTPAPGRMTWQSVSRWPSEHSPHERS